MSETDEFDIVGAQRAEQQATQRWLQVCWHPVWARVGAGHPPPRTEPKLFSFSSTLRSPLKGPAPYCIDMGSGTERIVELYFSGASMKNPFTS